jgi:hypothetical protein
MYLVQVKWPSAAITVIHQGLSDMRIGYGSCPNFKPGVVVLQAREMWHVSLIRILHIGDLVCGRINEGEVGMRGLDVE